MSMKYALAAAVWFLCVYAPVVAQDERPLNVKIVNSIREHEPEWQLSREEPVKHSEERKGGALEAVWAKGVGALTHRCVRA